MRNYVTEITGNGKFFYVFKQIKNLVRVPVVAHDEGGEL
jgi:hypothetical protein